MAMMISITLLEIRYKVTIHRKILPLRGICRLSAISQKTSTVPTHRLMATAPPRPTPTMPPGFFRYSMMKAMLMPIKTPPARLEKNG